MKLPKDIPFVILDRNMYGTQESSRLTEDFIEWLVRDCAHTAWMALGGASYKVSENSDAYHAQDHALAKASKAILSRYGLEPKEAA